MRWFKRGQPDTDAPSAPNEDHPESVRPTPPDTGAPDVPKVDDSESARPTPKDDVQESPQTGAELDARAQELRNLQDSIDALHAKMAGVKKEYNEAVGNLFDVKNELAATRRESAAANSTHDALQKRIGVLNEQLKESEAHRTELRNTVRGREDASHELARINGELDQKQKKLDAARKQVTAAYSELDTVQKKADLARAKLDEYGQLLQKTRTMIKETNTSKPAPKSDVIRTASSMIAALNEKVAKSNQEIQVLREALDRERRAGAEMRSKLADMDHKDAGG